MTNTFDYLVPRIFFLLLLACLFAGPFLIPSLLKRCRPDFLESSRKYQRLSYSSYLPLYVFLTCVFCIFLAHPLQKMFLQFFPIFLTLSLYNAVLLLLLPLLRKRINARACAGLWAIPNILYIFLYWNFARFFRSPQWVIYLPDHLLQGLCLGWFIGFVLILGWKIAEHFWFRHRLLSRTRPVTDPEILAVWEKILAEAKVHDSPYHIGICPKLRTPLSIGLFRKFTWVVLPEKEYSREDLELILQHEMIHIEREDNWLKLTWLVCTALCWFNPLLWLGARQSRKDIELSCDELVLLDSDSATRKRYADLLLTTAGDERGFTTCLSADARSLRYRLKSVMQPLQRSSGALVVLLFSLAVLSANGFAAVAYNHQTGAEGIFSGQDTALYTVTYVDRSNDELNHAAQYKAANEPALLDYLSGLQLYELSIDYPYSDSSRIDYYTLNSPEEEVYIKLYDHAISVTKHFADATKYSDAFQRATYYLPEKTDWELLQPCFIELPNLEFGYSSNDTSDSQNSAGFDWNAYATPSSLWEVKDGQKVLIDQESSAEYDVGLYGTLESNAIALQFPYEASPCSVQFTSWDGADQQDYSFPVFPKKVSIDIPFFPARCTVNIRYTAEDGIAYEGEYHFYIGGLEDDPSLIQE